MHHNLKEKTMCNPKAAFVGFGEVNTPREIVDRLCGGGRDHLESIGIDLITTDPVSDDPEGRDVARACSELEENDFDFLVLCLAGWIPSHAVIAVADRFRHKPMLLWGLTGWEEEGRLVTAAAQAGTTALRKTMEDLGYCFKYIVDFIGKPTDDAAVFSFAAAAQAAARLRGARIGMMGYRDMNLYATLHDGVSLRANIGPEVEVFEMLEMQQIIDSLEPDDVGALVESVRSRWEFEKEASDQTIQQAVKLYLAVKRKVEERNYEAVSLLDVDGVKKLMHFPPAAVFMLLHEEDNICTIPENDTMGAVTQLMTRYLTGQAAAYMEFYEFSEETMLIGVPDYVPSEITEGPVTVRPTAFGELGEGLLNISKVKTGPVTLSRLFYTGDRYGMHIVTGRADSPRPWEEAGWKPPAPQLPSLEVTPDSSVKDFIQKVMGQHYIISYGDNTDCLKDLCSILGVEVI